MKRYALKTEKRTVLGKKVKALRKKGLVPLSLYGKKQKSLSLQSDKNDFEKLLKSAGETGLVDVSVKGEQKTHTVLIHNPQYSPVYETLLHADLREVELKEKIKIEVPVILHGQSPAVEKNTGVLLHLVDKLEVEALPTDLPEEVSVDISSLDEIDKEITVKDISKKSDLFKVTAPETLVLVKISPPQKEEVVQAPKEEAVPAEGEQAPADEGKEKEESAPKETPAPTEKKKE